MYRKVSSLVSRNVEVSSMNTVQVKYTNAVWVTFSNTVQKYW